MHKNRTKKQKERAQEQAQRQVQTQRPTFLVSQESHENIKSEAIMYVQVTSEGKGEEREKIEVKNNIEK